MFWAVVSFMCSVNGCTPLPRVDFKNEAPAENCRVLRDAMVKPNKPAGDRWVEAYCTAIGGRYP